MNKNGVERMIMEQYGTLIYTAQMIEKMMISLTIESSNISASRYEELFFYKSQLTLGKIKNDLLIIGVFNAEELRKIDDFNDKRNYLVHHFFWDRTIKIYENNSELSILNELEEIQIEFNWIEKLVFNKSDKRAAKRSISNEQVEEILSRIEENIVVEPFRKLEKNETLINIELYKIYDTNIIPIFILGDDTYWTLCKSGLTQYREKIDFSKIESIPLLEGIFPIKQFNTNFRVNADWEYIIPLKSRNLQINVTPAKTTTKGAIAFRWVVEKKP